MKRVEYRAWERSRVRKSLNIRMRDLVGIVRRERVFLPIVDDAERPQTRGECLPMPRPCPYVACKWHLAFDITPAGGLVENFPGLELDQLADTCALDVADRGVTPLEDIAVRINATRARVGQIEEESLAKLGRWAGRLR